jgi:hypothetical protein
MRWSFVKMEKSSSCFHFWMIFRSAFDNMPRDCATEEFFVEVLLSREHSHRAIPRPGKRNPKHASLGGNDPPNSSKPRNVGSDPQRRPRIIQIHPHLISGVDIRQTLVCPAFQEIEDISRNFDFRGFVSAYATQLKFTFHMFRSLRKMDFTVSLRRPSLCAIFFWDRYPPLSTRARTASTFPLSRGLVDLGKSARSVGPLSKASFLFSMVRRVITSFPYTCPSSEWIAWLGAC